MDTVGLTPAEEKRRQRALKGQVRRRAPGGGRKPAGADGVKVSDYPAVLVRLPAATVASLRALAMVRGVSVSRVVDAAVGGYLATVHGDDAQDMRRLARREHERLEAKRMRP